MACRQFVVVRWRLYLTSSLYDLTNVVMAKVVQKINKLYFSCPCTYIPHRFALVVDDQRHTKVRMLFIPVDLAVLGSHPVDPESGKLSYGSFRVPAHHTITIQVRNSVKRQFSAYLLIVAILGRYLQKSNRCDLVRAPFIADLDAR